jgi:hypothetical protein
VIVKLGNLKILGEFYGVYDQFEVYLYMVENYTGVTRNALVVIEGRLQHTRRGGSVSGHTPFKVHGSTDPLPYGYSTLKPCSNGIALLRSTLHPLMYIE